MGLTAQVLVISTMLTILRKNWLLTHVFYEVVVLALIKYLSSASTWLSNLLVHGQLRLALHILSYNLILRNHTLLITRCSIILAKLSILLTTLWMVTSTFGVAVECVCCNSTIDTHLAIVYTIFIIRFILHLIWVWHVQYLLLSSVCFTRSNINLALEAIHGVSCSWLVDENVVVAVVYRLLWTLVVSEAVLSILTRASLIIFGIKSGTKTRFMNSISTVLNIALISSIVYHILLKLGALEGYLLLVSLLSLETIIWVDIVFSDNLLISITSRYWSSTRILLCLSLSRQAIPRVTIRSLCALSQLFLLVHLTI